MKAILQQWNLMRVLRLVLSLVIFGQGIISRDATSIVIGLLFAGLTLANIGCCATGSCAINTPSPKKNETPNG